MLIDGRTLPRAHTLETDVCIVGAGAAGITLAMELAGQPFRVLLVDSNCRVHGISNLFISGSSVFPTAGSGTPTLLIVALALRLADHLKRLLK